MLSRRNIRIKVLQLLYAKNRDEALSNEIIYQRYRSGLMQTYTIYLYSLQQFIKMTEYALEDKKRRAAKHLPSEADKLFSGKLFLNPLTQSLVTNRNLQQQFSQHPLPEPFDEDAIRKFYSAFAKTEEYQSYIETVEPTDEQHCAVLVKLYRDTSKDELYNESIDDRFNNWQADKSLVTGAMKKTLKALPAGSTFYEAYLPDQETTVDFGEALLKNALEEDQALLDIIEPVLQNWDADRVAVIDMIALKMAISELMIFPTIPTKVTLNEYVEMAKTYSTDKSKDFINGILDRLLKKLQSEGKIKKEGRGLVD